MSARVGDVADDLLRYGEPETSEWMLSCSEDELVRVCSVADWLLLHGPSEPSGSSMMIAKACALAAIYVREGAPRALARSRRLPGAAVPVVGLLCRCGSLGRHRGRRTGARYRLRLAFVERRVPVTARAVAAVGCRPLRARSATTWAEGTMTVKPAA